MTIRRRDILAAGGAALAAAALVPPRRAAAQQVRWQMATPYPDGNFHTRNIREFVGEIERASEGRLAVQVHSGASLLRMPEIKRGVQTGQVQMGEILLTAYANEDPFFDADALPFLVTNYQEAKKLSDLQKPYVEARLQRQGLMLLYMVPWPPAGFYTNEPLRSLEQLRGTRFRTFSPLTNRFAQLVGANPTLVQQAELAQAFATGIVQAMVTSAQTGVDTAAWDYVKVFTPAGFSMTKNAVIVRRRDFEAQPAALQQAIREAAERAEARGYRYSQEATESTQRTLAERGMTIGPVTPELRAQFQQVSRTMVDEWIARTGEDGRKLIEAYRAA
ncbi:C4-dicarboxylate ABC transporter substrate-binding protein [Caldovatus sediminis]|uniref:C4-dicarboxylate ABC transporter substrate-binding protein n=1 Tax=Caldovatus sediminis TaxID=2041189 RepID=A0A8J3EAF7_9PROT|nr:TRAP transporter substrate-binding protein [Caldovatus sediminis]GGG26572.1 C4-dicarboxylate ABC transporter substrate-binding protein [Caldovatus sediminis]